MDMNPQSPYPPQPGIPPQAPQAGPGLPPTLPQPITMQPASSGLSDNKKITWLWIALVSFFVLTNIGSGVWGYMQYDKMLHYKNDVDQIVAEENAKIKEETEKAKEEEFAEREKNPYRSYKGPSAYGSLQIIYPKTWATYSVEKDKGGLLVDGFLHPNFVPGFDSGTAFALRVQVLEQDYAQVMKKYVTASAKGTVKITPYKLPKVPSILGAKVIGEVEREYQGAGVYIPLRDKTIAIYTLSPSFVKDFNNIILPNVSFIP
jgi:hypothetical protein